MKTPKVYSDGYEETTDKAMEAVSNALAHAKRHGLETEVITWAFFALQGNPELSIGQALNMGLDEWDV